MTDNPNADFTLTLRRGEGMALLAMDWRGGTPPEDFVGFAIAYTPPGATQDRPVYNRLAFLNTDGTLNPDRQPTSRAPIQRFRWTHFPPTAEATEDPFVYEVTPVHMAADGTLGNGIAQTESIVLGGDTYPGVLNVAFTSGFISSQAFVDEFTPPPPIPSLFPDQSPHSTVDPLTFRASRPDAGEAYEFLGSEARTAIEQILDDAIHDTAATVYAVAYDLDVPEIVDRVARLGPRLHIIIDHSSSHGDPSSPESVTAARLRTQAGENHVQRGHMGDLQHNKMIVVDSPSNPTVVCGSTNFSWRGIFVQSNNAVIVRGSAVVRAFVSAFNDYSSHLDDPSGFAAVAPSPAWQPLDLGSLDAEITFSPHSGQTAVLGGIARDILSATSSVLYSLAFLWEAGGALRAAISALTEAGDILVYGVSDQKVGGIDVQRPNADPAPVHPASLNAEDTPAPFRAEPTGGLGPAGGGGVRMHHKFVVIDFDTPTARVYTGSFNFSTAADTANGENLLLIKDPRAATSYAVEALRIFDHYEFRLLQQNAATKQSQLALRRPPTKQNERPWWNDFYVDERKARDRTFFAR
jgi:hypothetical protein